jgi:hypothetical protein
MSQTAQARTSAATSTAAQQAASMNPEPQREHQWLQKLVGAWTYETDAGSKPGQPETKATGTEHVRSIGGLWVQLEGQGQIPGGSGPATTIMTLGFDPAKKRIVGTWIGSMMTHQWVYDGELDAGRNVLTLTSEGPSMSDQTRMALYRDTIELQGNDARTLTASVRGEDGSWQPFMTVRYRRV